MNFIDSCIAAQVNHYVNMAKFHEDNGDLDLKELMLQEAELMVASADTEGYEFISAS